MVICLEQGANLHMVQLMPLPLTVSCFIKIQIGFTFLVPAHPRSPRQRAVKRVCGSWSELLPKHDILQPCSTSHIIHMVRMNNFINTTSQLLLLLHFVTNCRHRLSRLVVQYRSSTDSGLMMSCLPIICYTKVTQLGYSQSG